MLLKCTSIMVQNVIMNIFFLFLYKVTANNVTNLCNSITTCGECIQQKSCAWCSDEDVGDIPRCFQPNLNLPYINGQCDEDQVYFPTNTVHFDGLSKRQIIPAKFNLQLRVNEPLYLVVNFDKLVDNAELSVVLNDNSSQYLTVDYISKCLSNYEENNIYCDNSTAIHNSRLIHFIINIMLKKCADEENHRYQQFHIFSENTTETLEVNVEMLCACPCENPGFSGYQLKAKQCNAVGTLKCGVCECDSAHTGRKCECPLKTYSKLGCKAPNTTDDVPCSGKGACLCNKCVCNNTRNIRKKISGNFCECDNFSCNRHNGKICGGNGVCNCGKCSCHSRYKGEACECYNSTAFCYPPFKKDGLTCSGHGECICGKCQCHITEDGGYHGKFCEKCMHCTDMCEELKPCVLCQVYHQGPYDDMECSEKCLMPVTTVDQVLVNSMNKDFLCNGQDINGCTYIFTYQGNKSDYNITAQKEVQCV